MYYGETCYGDEKLFEEIMNPIFHARKKAGIVKDYEDYIRSAKGKAIQKEDSRINDIQIIK